MEAPDSLIDSRKRLFQTFVQHDGLRVGQPGRSHSSAMICFCTARGASLITYLELLPDPTGSLAMVP